MSRKGERVNGGKKERKVEKGKEKRVGEERGGKDNGKKQERRKG